MSADIFLAKVSESVAEFKPAETGSAVLLSGSHVIASVNKDYNGTDISEHPEDKFLTKVGTVVQPAEAMRCRRSAAIMYPSTMWKVRTGPWSHM